MINFLPGIKCVMSGQGRVIGNNITGGDDTHKGVLNTAVCKMFDWSLGATGLFQ